MGVKKISATLGALTALACGGLTADTAGHGLTAKVNGHQVHFVLPHTAAAAAAGNNLAYNGGPVEAGGSTNYAIFWEPALTAAVHGVSATYNSLISRFLTDIGGSGLYGVATQYYQVSIANSSTLGGTWVDTSNYQPRPSPMRTSRPR